MTKNEKLQLLATLAKLSCEDNGVYCLVNGDAAPHKMKGFFIEDEDNIIISLENEKDISSPIEVYISEIKKYSTDRTKLVNSNTLYNELIRTIMLENNIKKIDFTNGKHIKSIELTCLDTLKITLQPAENGFCLLLKRLAFDFGVDYATVLFQIETDLFRTQHLTPANFGLKFTYRD